MNIRPNQKLHSLLLEAYQPCSNFGVCREAKWCPSEGHIPRGFLGATGDLSEVEVVMVFSEPGHSHGDEEYDPKLSPLELLDAGLQHTYTCFANGRDQFHQNARWFMSRLYPDLTFDQQLRRIWLTEGRLCSIAVETKNTKDPTCAAYYLACQVQTLTSATFVAFGGKAKDYLGRISSSWIGAYALSPPGANHKPVRPSWEAAIVEIEARRAFT